MKKQSIIKQPVIKQALGESWHELADIVKQHYDITPGTHAEITVKGTMDEVYHSDIAKLFILTGKIFGALVPYRGKNIPTTVKNRTMENSNAMHWYRTLFFPNKKPFIFESRMVNIKDNEIVEYVRYGMGVRMLVSVKDNALVFKGIGFHWKISGFIIPISNWAVLGTVEIIEQAIDDKNFYMQFEMKHPVFGKTFAYSGTFHIS